MTMNKRLTILTNGTEEAEEKQQNDTPDDISVDFGFKLTNFVPGAFIIQHSFGLWA